MKKSEILALAGKMKDAAMRKARFSVGEPRGPSNELELHKGSVVGSDNFAMKVRKFQETSDCLLLLSKSMGIPIDKLAPYSAFKRFTEEDSELKKVMTLTTQANWIPTDFSADFVDKVNLTLRVAAQFPEIVMARGLQSFSVKGDFSTAYIKTEGSDATISPALTDTKGTLTAKVIAVYQSISDELDQDAAFAQMPMLRNDCILAIGRAIENAVINGDDSTTHMDSDVTLSYAQEKAWKGLRQLCLANSYKTDLSTFNANTLCALIGTMGVYGADPSQLMLIVGPAVRVKLMNLLDSSSNRVFLEYGSPGAMNVRMVPGGVGVLAGSDVVVSEFCREDLNALGYYDSTVKTKASLLWVRKDCFVKGVSRRMLVETDRDIVAQNTKLVVSTRMDFQPRVTVSSNKCVYMGYNI